MTDKRICPECGDTGYQTSEPLPCIKGCKPPDNEEALRRLRAHEEKVISDAQWEMCKPPRKTADEVITMRKDRCPANRGEKCTCGFHQTVESKPPEPTGGGSLDTHGGPTGAHEFAEPERCAKCKVTVATDGTCLCTPEPEAPKRIYFDPTSLYLTSQPNEPGDNRVEYVRADIFDKTYSTLLDDVKRLERERHKEAAERWDVDEWWEEECDIEWHASPGFVTNCRVCYKDRLRAEREAERTRIEKALEGLHAHEFVTAKWGPPVLFITRDEALKAVRDA